MRLPLADEINPSNQTMLYQIRMIEVTTINTMAMIPICFVFGSAERIYFIAGQELIARYAIQGRAMLNA